jgi:polyisoprenoid-binding protein YceI
MLLGLAAIAALAFTPSAAEYVIPSGDDTDTVRFESTASLEFIEGKTTVVDGKLTLDPQMPAHTTGLVRVDLRTLKTGIDLRDQHMRERHLDTEEFPFAYFEITGMNAADVPLTVNQAYPADVEGWFYIRGVKRRLTADTQLLPRISRSGDTVMTVAATFEIKLDEYGIPRPKALFMKLAETIKVTIDLTAVPGSPSSNITLPDWPVKD